jgi:hypothetical protein
MKIVKVFLYHGVVEVDNPHEDVLIELYDYDCDGVDEEDLERDENDRAFIKTEWSNGPTEGDKIDLKLA